MGKSLTFWARAACVPMAAATLGACGSSNSSNSSSASSGGGGASSSPITIGVVTALSGSGAQSGQYKVNGAKLAVDEINKAGGVLGRQLRLDVVDDQTTNPGTVNAFSKVTGDGVTAVVGPIRSTEVQAITPAIEQTGIPVMIGGTDPKLTHEGDRWVFRERPNDTYSAAAIANFGVTAKGVKTWAVVTSSDAFGTGGKNAVEPDISRAGGKVVLDQSYPNHSQDFTSTVLAIKKSGAQGLVTYCTYGTDCAILARQIQQQHVQLTWVGSPSLSDVDTLGLAGSALDGTYSVADFAAAATPTSQAFATKYMATYHVAADNYGSWSYDAINILARAIKDAKSTKPDAIRTAILAIKGMPGAEGTYNFDSNGDGLTAYNIVQDQGGTIKFVQRVNGASS